MNQLRPDLAPLPDRLRKLSIDERGYPVPWFVPWVDGAPEFRAMDVEKLVMAVKQRRCWVCGEPLGRWLAFPIGPMCAVTRTVAEPPSHQECAEWSVIHCPFLSQPRMERRTEGIEDLMGNAAGLPVVRNPGVTCVWTTRSYEKFSDGRGKVLFTMGAPERLSWWREGRQATVAEIDESIDGGLPILMATARTEGAFAVEELGKCVERARALYR